MRTFRFLRAASQGVTASIIGAALTSIVLGCFVAGRIDVKTADTPRYRRLAMNLVRHGVFSSCEAPPYQPEIQRVPGYPVFLALLGRVGVRSDRAIATSQVGLHALVVLVIGSLLPSHRVVTAWVFALYPYSLVLCVRLMSEGLTEFVLVAGLCCLAQAVARERSRLVWYAAAGLWLAALTLTRPIYLFMPAVLALGAAFLGRGEAHRRWTRLELIVFVAFGTLPGAAWAVRTSEIARRPLPLALNWAGSNLWLATWEYRIAYEDLEGALFSRDDPRNEGVTMDLNECDSDLNLAESDHARDVAVRRIREAPGRYVMECLWRSVRVWLTWEITAAGGRAMRWASPILRYTSITILALAVAGSWFARRQVNVALTLTIPCIYISILHMPIHVSGRYSHPARGLLIALAVLAVTTIFRSLRPLIWGRKS
mgnify:CR=1 FL=1